MWGQVLHCCNLFNVVARRKEDSKDLSAIGIFHSSIGSRAGIIAGVTPVLHQCDTGNCSAISTSIGS